MSQSGWAHNANSSQSQKIIACETKKKKKKQEEKKNIWNKTNFVDQARGGEWAKHKILINILTVPCMYEL